MFRYLAIGIILLGTSVIGIGQSNLIKEADLYFQQGHYHKALGAYKRYNQNKPGNDLVLTRLGICNFHTGNTSNAINSLNAVLSTAKKPDPDTYLYLAKSHHAEGAFLKASNAYKSFLGKTKIDHPLRKNVRDAIKRCGSGIQLQAVKANAIVENIGKSINTPNDEYSVVLSPTYSDRIYFSSVRPSNIGGLRNGSGQLDVKYGTNTSDVYSARIVNGSWDNVSALGGNLNSERDDHVLDFSRDGQSLLLWKSANGYAGDVIVDTFSNDGMVRRGIFNAPISGKDGDGGLMFYNDTTILFYSDRPGGQGGLDLYTSFYSNGQWSQAYNLGAEINSAYDDISPFLSADGSTLYFASNRPSSIGGFDLFKSSFQVGQQLWGKPSNLGTPINSGRDDYQLRLGSKGLQGYFVSNRPSGEGKLDIYVIYFKNYLNEQKSDNIIASLQPLLKAATENDVSGETISFDESQIKKYSLDPLYYDENDRILSPSNISTLDQVVDILQLNPSVNIEVVGSSDQSASVEFDLYFSIKRAEEIADYLVQKGIAVSRVISRSAGQTYPLVRHTVNGQEVLLAKKLNRRVEFIFKNTDGLPLEINFTKPDVKNPGLTLNGIERIANQSKGLSYRIQVARTGSMYKGSIISNYPDALIDRPMDTELYRYTIGMYGIYQSAQFMKNDLIAKGVVDCKVIAFLDGKELTMDTALFMIDDYPDLGNFLVGEQ